MAEPVSDLSQPGAIDTLSAALIVSRSLHLRWLYAYVLSAVLSVIGLVTFLFMLRVI